MTEEAATPIADMVEFMAAQGVALDVILVAVRTIETERYASVTRNVTERYADVTLSQTPGAIRGRAFRERKRIIKGLALANDVANSRDDAVTRGVTRNVTHNATVTPHSNLEEVFSQQEGKDLDSETEHNLSTRRESKELKTKELKTIDKKQQRGTRIPDDWQPSDADRQFAAGEGVDPDHLRDEFVDFWVGVPGQRGTKLSWSATWRNRVRAVAGKPQHQIRRRSNFDDGVPDFPGAV